MENFEMCVPEKELKNDFSIIYKGIQEQEGQITEQIEEIRTSKEEFLQYLLSKILFTHLLMGKLLLMRKITQTFINSAVSMNIMNYKK